MQRIWTEMRFKYAKVEGFTLPGSTNSEDTNMVLFGETSPKLLGLGCEVLVEDSCSYNRSHIFL